jgi:hypothetical protein
MSDDGLMNLEDDAPVPEPDTPPEPVAPPEPPAPDDDPEAVDIGGQKAVPLAVVRDLREKVRSLSEKAQRADQLEAWQRENEPALRFLQNNRDLLIQRAQPDPPQAQPTIDPDAREAALLMDFYRPDGTPDDERGSKWLALQEKRANRIAEQQFAPIRQRTQQDQAAANYQLARQVQDANGEKPSEASLNAIWRQMPPELVADPSVAGVMAALALGLDRLNAPKRGPVVAPPANPPLMTESSGGHPAAKPTLSPLEERIAADRGVSQTKWQENTRGYRPGRAMTLED